MEAADTRRPNQMSDANLGHVVVMLFRLIIMATKVTVVIGIVAAVSGMDQMG